MNYNKILENNQLEFQEVVSEKLMCLLCRMILKEPHIVPCGHSYCFSCVKNHIKNESPFCIGGDSECNLEPLDMSKNVVKDFRVHKEISELKVKCVNKNCCDFVEIKNMELHMESCRFKMTSCPFEIVGCTVKGLNQNDLKDHLVQNSLDHATIMTKCVEELRNKNDELLLKNDRMQQQFEQVNNEVLESITNLESKIIEENRNLKNEIMEEIKKLSDQIKEGNDKKIKRMNIGENYVVVDKEVKVTFDNVSEKERDKDYKSDLFILERYSFKIEMCYKSNNLITFGMYLVEGQYDEEVSWPMKRTIQMNIMNSDGNLYNCHEFNYDTGIEKWKSDYDKPDKYELIIDSEIAICINQISNNNAVTVIVKMND